MCAFVRLLCWTLFACACAVALAENVRAEEAPAAIAPDALPTKVAVDPSALAEAYFDEAERFDGFLTYEVRRGPARALFTISRRWRDGLAELVFDVREPASFDKWALLMRQNRGQSDDLFLYAGSATDGKVRRLAAAQIERQALFELLAVGDYRPTPRGELAYELAPDERLDTTPCHVVRARAPNGNLGFDRLDLVFAADTGLLLESRFLRGDVEVRRLSARPEDYREVEGRRLPFRRVAHRWADGGETEIVLQRVVESSNLPDGLFSTLNLRVQHFPRF
ncbi:MAG: outer membrane lipoprotein-sorting protein [Myxococcota bacterium]